MRNAATILIVTSFLVSVSARADSNDLIKWQFTCRENGFYSMDVFPSGQYLPQTDFKDYGTIEVSIVEANKDTISYCNYSEYENNYYAEIKGNNGLANEYTSSFSNRHECNKLLVIYNVQNEGKGKPLTRSLESVTGSSLESTSSMSIILSLDDNEEWKFIINNVGLTTNKKRRQLKIMSPLPPGVTYDASASTWMLTGQCLMTAGPSKE